MLCLGIGCSGGSAPPVEETPDAGPDAQPDAGGDPPGAGPTDEHIFDQALFHEFELEIAPEDWQWLRENPLLEQYVPATLVFEGQRYPVAAVRYKGDWNSLHECFQDGVQVCPKLSIKVSFNEYGPSRFAGLRKLVFNSAITDDTMMREVVGYWVYRQMGVPAPRATHARLTINGEWQGVFVLVENVDKEFIEDHWILDQGNLYKSVWPQWDTEERYVEALRTNEATPEVSGMLALKSILDTTSDDTFATDIAGILDLSDMARFLAVDQAINNADGSAFFYCYDRDAGWQECENNNYYWYEEPNGQFHLIPWDLDYSLWDANTDMGRSRWSQDCAPIPACVYWNDADCVPEEETIALRPAQCDPLYGHVQRATWDPYRAALAELLSGPFSEAEVSAFVQAQRDKIRDAVAEDPFGPGMATWLDENEWLDEVLALQRAEIARLLAEP